jgi:hypothetical protein
MHRTEDMKFLAKSELRDIEDKKSYCIQIVYRAHGILVSDQLVAYRILVADHNA